MLRGKKFVASLSQIPPIMPILTTQPTHKSRAVYYLAEDSFHGMEEVIGSIPIRSTSYFTDLETLPSALSHTCRKFQTTPLTGFGSGISYCAVGIYLLGSAKTLSVFAQVKRSRYLVTTVLST